MELPRNITQVGETDRNCKIYVEDYVVSYMKQMNKFAEDKEIAVALYGKMSEEQQITYCFVYGACVIQSVSGQVRHLSQAQNQEIERLRKKYFPEQTFLGYQILNGEMIEGFRIYDQNSCRYVKGYACFFEKNDAMLAYMLETRSEEAQPEVVEQDKYDMVRKRQEDRKRQFEDKKQQFEDRSQGRRRHAEEKAEARRRDEISAASRMEARKSDESAAVKKQTEAARGDDRENYRFKVAPFVLLAGSCLIAMTVWSNENTLESAKGRLTAWVSGITESKLSTEDDAGQQNSVMEVLGQAVVIDDGTEKKGTGAENIETEDREAAGTENLQTTNESANISGQEMQSAVSTLVTEDKLAEAILEENQKAADGGNQEEATQSETGADQETQEQQDAGADQESQAQQETATQPETTAPPETTSQPETYIIRQGDTLIAISKNRYGSDSFVSEICALNNISNPDNIQIGQKILLP